MRSLARRIQAATVEADQLEHEILAHVCALAPTLLDEPGVGPIVAAQLLVAWSHRGRLRSEAAFARLAGVAPVPASSGQTRRHRLSRGGDRQLNRALHTIVLHRRQHDPATRDYIARRVQALAAEERELKREIQALVARLAGALLDEPGIGPVAAAQVLLSWSHRGRFRSEAAFARLAGAAPIPASSGQTVRYRLDRSGDRKLNRTLHQIILTRRRTHAPTIAYIDRRIQQGKSRREATRCLKRYLARSLYRLLENPPMTA